MKECEVCGRPIRTGRKYCFEHRNSQDGFRINKEKLLSQATKAWIKFKLGKFWTFVHFGG